MYVIIRRIFFFFKITQHLNEATHLSKSLANLRKKKNNGTVRTIKWSTIFWFLGGKWGVLHLSDFESIQMSGYQKELCLETTAVSAASKHLWIRRTKSHWNFLPQNTKFSSNWANFSILLSEIDIYRLVDFKHDQIQHFGKYLPTCKCGKILIFGMVIVALYSDKEQLPKYGLICLSLSRKIHSSLSLSTRYMIYIYIFFFSGE